MLAAWSNGDERCDSDTHGLGSKLNCVVRLCPRERLFMALSSAWQS